MGKQSVDENSDEYHGTVRYAKTSREAEKLKSVNIFFSFEEAMKLSLAIQSCVLRLNKLDKRTAKGKKMGMQLGLKTETETVMVTEEEIS
jgi:hypothetical protein